ncbi:hypothetical protein D3C72_2379270 [compost metagenome]
MSFDSRTFTPPNRTKPLLLLTWMAGVMATVVKASSSEVSVARILAVRLLAQNGSLVTYGLNLPGR